VRGWLIGLHLGRSVLHEVVNEGEHGVPLSFSLRIEIFAVEVA
jgi:hypothetical protein